MEGEKMQTFTFTEGKYSCKVFKLAEEACPCVYAIVDSEDEQDLLNALAGQKLVLVALRGITWEDELSPWPAAKSFPGGKDFKGGADAFIQRIETKIMPRVDRGLDFAPSYNVIAGYSLAGLWSLYALYKTKIFQRAVCASGSLWYDGFLDFMREHQMSALPEKVYFSLGDREKITKNKRLAVVEERTQDAVAILQQKGVQTIFEMNKGGHFQDTTERLAKGIRWIL
jgi:predicted alpha/beta superfamily hydrolase